MSDCVYRRYNQAALDAQYDQRTLVADLGPYLQRWQNDGERAGVSHKPEAGVAYGDNPREVLDIFRPAGPSKGLHIHYHGGAWRLLGSRDAWFIAPAWLARDYTFVSVNFGLVPEVSLATQVDQARKALVWCQKNAIALGMDPGRMTVSGHSSGAHLAAMAGLADWARPQPAVQAVILGSGLYDLEPVQLSSRNDYLGLSPEDALALSPVRHLRAETVPCSVLWSTNELDEFQRQSEQFARSLTRNGLVQRHPVGVDTHFDTWDLVNPDLIEALVD